MSPQRIQRLRVKGWRMPDGAVYVGRPTRFGNPFTVEGARDAGYIGTDAELKQSCVVRYREWLTGDDDGDQDRYLCSDGRTYDRIEERVRLHELAGRDLACWCPLDQPCHADVLLELANRDVAGAATEDLGLGEGTGSDLAAPATTTADLSP